MDSRLMPIRLRPSSFDEWYLTVNRIYYDRNFYRTPESLMCHLVEVVGALSIVASRKGRPGVDPDDWTDQFLAKSIGWWMVLCGKVGIGSINDLLWAKFPYACSYCQECPHSQAACARVRIVEDHPNWERLQEIGHEKEAKKPRTLREWRTMFGKLYPRTDQTRQESNFARLTEELGELAEAVRVLPITRSYFLSEAADVFAWLVGVANQLEAEDYGRRPGERRRWLEADEHLDVILWNEYPGVCGYCRGDSCKCPPIPVTSMNRIAHEGPVVPGESNVTLFSSAEALEFFRLGEKVAVGDTSILLYNVRRELAMLTVAVQAAASASAGSADRMTDRLREVADGIAQLQVAETGTQERVDGVVALLQSLPGPALSTVQSILINLNAGVLLELIKLAIPGMH